MILGVMTIGICLARRSLKPAGLVIEEVGLSVQRVGCREAECFATIAWDDR